MRALLILVAAAACGPTPVASTTPPSTGTTADAAPVATGGSGAGCVADKGCPAPEAIPSCPGRMAARPFTEIMDTADQLIGQEVLIAGTLYQSGAGCTRMHCGERACCNRCNARVELGPDAMLGLTTGRLALDPGGDGRFACSGDDTGVCCAIPLDGGLVAVTGRLAQEAGVYLLREVELCAP